MEWLALGLVIALCVFGSYLSFDQAARQHPWYLVVGCLLGAAVSTLWYLVVRRMPLASVYFYSMCWDVAVTLTYCLVPVLWFGVTLNLPQVAGVVLIVGGLVLMKC